MIRRDEVTERLAHALEHHHHPRTAVVEAAREVLRAELAAIPPDEDPAEVHRARRAALRRFEAAIAESPKGGR